MYQVYLLVIVGMSKKVGCNSQVVGRVLSVLHPCPWTKNLAQKFKILPTSLLQFFLLTKEKVGRGILSRRFENLVKKVKILPTLLLQFCFLINRGCKSSKFCILSPRIWRKSLKFCRCHFCNLGSL